MKQVTAKGNTQTIQGIVAGQGGVGTPSSNISNTQKVQQNAQMISQQQQSQAANQQRYQDMKRIEDYTFCLSDLVGKGASGTVYLGENSVTKEMVAIKVIDLHQVKDEYTWGLICQEIDIMKKLSCENVVKLIDVFQTQNNAYIVTELCEDGDLVDYMKRHAGKIRQNQAVKIITDILKGLQELAKHGIIHRDLKPANILIAKKDTFKITDFGFARMVEKNDYLMTSLVGTPLYMSPQILKRQMYTSKCDVWSIGLIFFELIYGQTPWPSNSVIDLVNNMFSNPLRFPNNGQTGDVILEGVKDFIRGCLKFEEADRLGWEEVYKHVLFRDALYACSLKGVNNSSATGNNGPMSTQDERSSQLKSPNHQRDSQNKKGSFASSFQTSFMTSYTSAGTTNTSKSAAKGNNNSNNYSSKQQNNLYSTQKNAKGSAAQTNTKAAPQVAQINNTSNLNGQSSTSTNATNFNSTGNNGAANTTLSTSSNSSNHNNNNITSNNNNNNNNQNQPTTQTTGTISSNNNNVQQILLNQQGSKTYSKQNSRQNTPSLQKQILSQGSQFCSNANTSGSASTNALNTAATSENKGNQNIFENSQQSTPRQQTKGGNLSSMSKQFAGVQSNGVIPQSGSFILSSPGPAQPSSSSLSQQSSFNTYNRQSQVNSPQLKDKKNSGIIGSSYQASSYMQSQSQNKLDNIRSQYKKQVKDKKSTDFQYNTQCSSNNLPSENNLNSQFAPVNNNSAVCYGSLNQNHSEKANQISNATGVGSSASASSFNFIHKRQKSARDVITNYNSAQNNFYIPLASPTKQQITSDKYRILTEPNQFNYCKDSLSPNKNNTILGINRESTLQNNLNNQAQQQLQSSSSPLSTEPSQNPVPTVLITLGSMNQIPGGNSTNNGQVNFPPQIDQLSGNMLNFSNDQSGDIDSPHVSPIYPANQQQASNQKALNIIKNLEPINTGTPEKNVVLHLKPGFYQQRGYSKNNTRSITPTMSTSAQKVISSTNTSNNTPKISNSSELSGNGQSNSKKALSNFNKFATYVCNQEERSANKIQPTNGGNYSNNNNNNSQTSPYSTGVSNNSYNNKRQKFNNRLSQHHQQNQITLIGSSGKQTEGKNNQNNNIQSINFDPFKTADQILTHNFAIQDEFLEMTHSPKAADKADFEQQLDQQSANSNQISSSQFASAINFNKPTHNYIQLTLNSSSSHQSNQAHSVGAVHFQSEKKVCHSTNSQSPTSKGSSNIGLAGKQHFPSHQYKSYDFSSQISSGNQTGNGIGNNISSTISINNNIPSSQFVPRNSSNQIPSPLPQVVQFKLEEQTDNKYSDTNSEKSPSHVLNNPIINLNRREVTNQPLSQNIQTNLSQQYPLSSKQQIPATGNQSATSSFICTPATNNSNVFSQLYNMEINNQQVNSSANHVAVNLCGQNSLVSIPIMDTKSVATNLVGSTTQVNPIDLKKTHSDYFSPQIKNTKFQLFDSNVPSAVSNTTSNLQNIQNIQAALSQGLHSRSNQKSTDFTSYQRNFISSFVQEDTYSSVDILNNYLNFCKLVFNLVRIINNSNFDKNIFTTSNCLLEKVTFILLKNAMMKLVKVNEKMYGNGDNIFNLSDWSTFKMSGKYTEMQTSFFLLYTEIQSSFDAEWNKGNNHSSQSQLLTSDYSFMQLFNKEMVDDIRFYSISLTFIKQFITLLNSKLAASPLTSLANPNPIFADKNDIVVVTVLDDFLQYHEILKTNLICMDTFHNQIFIKFNQFLSKFLNTYNYLTLMSKTYDSQFYSNIYSKLREIGI